MRFNVGDIVIKYTGGNKMIVTKVINNLIYCTWFVDKIYDGCFDEQELIPIIEYSRILKSEELNDKINKLIN